MALLLAAAAAQGRKRYLALVRTRGACKCPDKKLLFPRRELFNRPNRRPPTTDGYQKVLPARDAVKKPAKAGQQRGPEWGSSFVDLGPMPRSFYLRHDSTILKPQFSGKSAWSGLLGLTGVNAFVFAMWNSEEEGFSEEFMMCNFTADITNVAEGRIWSLAGASVSHQDAMHLLGNMFAMWLFGFPTYRVIGTKAFLGLYLAGGLACSSTHVLHNILTGRTQPPLSKGERERLEQLAELYGVRSLPTAAADRVAHADKPSLGASGSVMAISAVAAALFPLDNVRVHPRAFYMPLPLAVALFVGSDLMGLTNEGSSVDHAGHLGGLFMGAFYVTAAWYSRWDVFRILHSIPTGGQLPIFYRLKQMLRRKN